MTESYTNPNLADSLARETVLADYILGWQSRSASLLGRKEVLLGKAKFGIFGDGKELPQLAMAKVFRNGDFRSGYYRDQTFMFATGMLEFSAFFAQLYAHADVAAEPVSGGRLMNAHFGSRLLDEQGGWLDQLAQPNSSVDISPTAGQMPRLLGLAYASKLYRQVDGLAELSQGFSRNGNEVCFGTIGNASTSEGHFFEALNAAAVLQVPMLMSVWDDGYGISVPGELQTAKNSISKMLSGMQHGPDGRGIDVYVVRGWDYEALIDTYARAAAKVRETHTPALVHVTELTQPQGHSTSGSHERYKSKERLDWEAEYDCLLRFRQWILEKELATSSELDDIERDARAFAEAKRTSAYEAMFASFVDDRARVVAAIKVAIGELDKRGIPVPPDLPNVLRAIEVPLCRNRKILHSGLVRTLALLHNKPAEVYNGVHQLLAELTEENVRRYSSHLYSESSESGLSLSEVPVRYGEQPEMVDGRVVLNRCFDLHFSRDPRIFAVGEDIGKLGGVNLVFEGLQAKYGELRVADTGIREATIAGQGIGAAMRGLRPIVDIQYLDYLLYALQTLSDDLATLHHRSAGGQKAPVVVRTKGHRLEGMWHAGSPMAVILGAVRGMYVLVPRNMTQAAGFYNGLLRSDNPALVIEPLNGYRTKEPLPDNVADFTIPLGVPEILREGTDLTLVTYGSLCHIAVDAAEYAHRVFGISAEVIDVRSLLPFDRQQMIVRSLKKTNALVVADEDVPGGASAFILQQILEVQGGFAWLDATPRTLTARAHRPPYGSDGDYFSKPSTEDLIRAIYSSAAELQPQRFPIHVFPQLITFV